jgi:hypothetical protein
LSEARSFTVEEANATLDELREALPRLREARRALIAAGRRINERIVNDGGGIEGKDHFEARATLRTEIEKLAETGILLRDPETGLVDFPGEVEGRPVYLCWRLGEDQVAFYHELESGFVGRKPL